MQDLVPGVPGTTRYTTSLLLHVAVVCASNPANHPALYSGFKPKRRAHLTLLSQCRRALH